MNYYYYIKGNTENKISEKEVLALANAIYNSRELARINKSQNKGKVAEKCDNLEVAFLNFSGKKTGAKIKLHKDDLYRKTSPIKEVPEISKERWQNICDWLYVNLSAFAEENKLPFFGFMTLDLIDFLLVEAGLKDVANVQIH